MRVLDADCELAYASGVRVRPVLALDLEGFSVTVLFGPSGSGKSTVLRCLAGLERPTTGHIRCGDEVWLDAPRRFLPAHRRSVGFVAQEGSLFPHLDVAGNLAYGLDRLGRDARRRRVAEVADLMGLAGLEDRRPSQLSGGQRQRVALGRALARRPDLLLLDEPFTGLDQPSVAQLRPVLRGLLREAATPVVLVTHDRTDALRLGDRILVMADGGVLQQGPMEEVFERPADPSVARILGVETVHLGRCLEVADGLARLAVGGASLLAADPGTPFRSAWICIRGEDVLLEVGAATSTARNRLPGAITALHPEGPLVRVDLDCGFPLAALVTRRACAELGLEPGLTVTAVVKAAAIHLIPHD